MQIVIINPGFISHGLAEAVSNADPDTSHLVIN